MKGKLMRAGVATLLLLLAAPLLAAPCTTPPKDGLRVDEIQMAMYDDGYRVALAWPSLDPNVACCARADMDRTAWLTIFRDRMTAGNESISLSSFIASVTDFPGGALSASEITRCNAMMQKILPTGPKVVRNAQRADGARPAKLLKDPAQPYSATNTLINYLVNKEQVYIEAGRQCEASPVVNVTTAGQWLYAVNLAGQRGIVLCK